MPKVSFLYMTAANQASAKKIVHGLLKEHLIACANIIPAIESIYIWNGQLHQESECAVIMKTQSDLVAKVTDRIVTEHDYDCPCVVEWPIRQGHPAFLKWVEGQTKV